MHMICFLMFCLGQINHTFYVRFMYSFQFQNILQYKKAINRRVMAEMRSINQTKPMFFSEKLWGNYDFYFIWICIFYQAVIIQRM